MEIKNASDNSIALAKAILMKGGPIVYPTSTLYALGVDARNAAAVDLVFEIKGRELDHPISVAVTNISMIRELAMFSAGQASVVGSLERLPITFLVKAKAGVHEGLVGPDSTLAFRFPQHQVAERIIKEVGPLTATSANLHRREDPVDVEQAANMLKDTVPLYLRGSKGKYGKMTTLLDIRGRAVRIVRYGAASRKAIEGALPDGTTVE